jgi:hypothetical protein
VLTKLFRRFRVGNETVKVHHRFNPFRVTTFELSEPFYDTSGLKSRQTYVGKVIAIPDVRDCFIRSNRTLEIRQWNPRRSTCEQVVRALTSAHQLAQQSFSRGWNPGMRGA